MNVRMLPLGVVGVLALGAVPASAQVPPGSATYKVSGGLATSKMRYFAPSQQVVLRGRVKPAVPGEVLTLYAIRGKKATKKIRRKVGKAGRFEFRFKVGNPGLVRLGVKHAASPAQGAFRARAQRISVVDWQAGAGEKGVKVLLLQRALVREGFAAPITGYYDDGTARGVLAFRKANGLGETAMPPSRCSPCWRAAKAPSSCAIRRPASTWSSTGRVRCSCWPRVGSRTGPTTPLRARPPRQRFSAPSGSTCRRRAPIHPGWSTPPTSSAATPSTATPRCRSTRPAMGACGCRSRMRSRSSTGRHRDTIQLRGASRGRAQQEHARVAGLRVPLSPAIRAGQVRAEWPQRPLTAASEGPGRRRAGGDSGGPGGSRSGGRLDRDGAEVGSAAQLARWHRRRVDRRRPARPYGRRLDGAATGSAGTRRLDGAARERPYGGRLHGLLPARRETRGLEGAPTGSNGTGRPGLTGAATLAGTTARG